jgi:hypothetical protein
MALFLSTSFDADLADFWPAALVWAFFVFAFDRQIISSLAGTKVLDEVEDSRTAPTAEKKGGSRRWKIYATRVLIALLIALFVSEAFTTRLFSDEIDSELETIVNTRVSDIQEEVRARPEIAQREQYLADRTALLESGDIPERWAGPLQRATRRLETRINNLVREAQSQVAETGYLDEQLALWRATTSEPVLLVSRGLVTLLLLLIELAPVLLKIWAGTTAHDEWLFYESELERMRARKWYRVELELLDPENRFGRRWDSPRDPPDLDLTGKNPAPAPDAEPDDDPVYTPA